MTRFERIRRGRCTSGFQAIVHHSAGGILVVDDTGRIVFANPAAGALFGSSAQALLGTTLDAPLTPGQAAEIEHSGTDARVRTLELRVTGIDWNGQAARLASVRDISDRKQTELALELTRFAIDHASDGAVWLRPDGSHYYVNDAMCRLSGYSRHELLSMTVFDSDPALTLQAWQAHWAELKQQGWLSFESLAMRKDGTTVALDVQARLAVFQGREYNCASVRDVTERKHRDESLQAHARQQAAVADLGQRALEGMALPELRSTAAALVCDVFGLEFSTVLERHADTARLVAGVGWKDGLVGHDTLPVDPQSQAGYALLSGEPVIVTDWRAETRFRGAAVLHEHGVISGINVVIPGAAGSSGKPPASPWGVLGAHASRPREFTSDDINFMQSVANILAQAAQNARADAAIRESDILLQVAGRTARLGGWEVDPGADRVTWSDEVCAIHDVAPGTTLTLQQAWEFYTPDSRERAVQISRACLRDGQPFDEEMEIITARDRHVWVRTVGEAVRDDEGRITRARGALQDITARKQAENEINFLALYDPLTRLPNPRLLHDRLQQALAASLRDKSKGAVIFLDLDGFKILNDTLGHDKGDQLLQSVAERLRENLREGDTVARFGGDEFVLIIGGLSACAEGAAMQAETIGEQLLATLNRPYSLGAHERHSTPSVGITLFGDSGDTATDLLKQADFAMYQAKAQGRNTLRLFDPGMQAAVSARVALEAEMRDGLQRGEFFACYQPQVDAAGRVTGAEALARWQHPERGIISPAEFIPLAEETGLILPLGQVMLETACAQLARWAQRAETAPLNLAVNVSAQQFHHPDFVAQVLGVVEQAGADPRRLKLEPTETLLLQDVEDTVTKMTALTDHGFDFSLDDFGTGYSSLYYLKRLPLQQLKIDQRFVRDVLTNPNDAAIARTIILLAQSLGLEAIAEGVETEAVRGFLADRGCFAYQGYLFSRPLPIEAFETFLQNGSSE